MSTRPAGRGWAYTGALLGGAVSIAANVAHSYVPPSGATAGWSPESGAVGGAVFWPCALFVAIEILARTAWPAGWRWWCVRFGGLLPVALVAAVVSYRHLSGLLAFYGEDPLTVVIGPLAVDGLMVVATGALVASSAARTVIAARDVTHLAAGAAAVTTPDTGPDSTPDIGADTTRTAKRTPRRPDTATAIGRLRDRHPDMATAEIAKRLQVSDRTVRRHLNTTSQTDPATLAA